MGDLSSPTSRMTRRGLLVAGAGLVAAGALDACTPLTTRTGTPKPTASPTPSPTPTPTRTPSPSPSPPSTPARPALPHNGLVGDGVADDAPALQRLLLAAAARRTVVDLPAGARLRLRSSVHVPSNTRLRGNGATLINGVPGDGGYILGVNSAQDVVIENIVLDGAKQNYRGRTEHRHNLVISRSRRVTIDNIRSYRAKGDGLYVGGGAADLCSDIAVSRSVFDGNHRQGMSLTCVAGITVTSCRFTGTAGTAPGAGVDIEPNADDSIIQDVEFLGCTFSGNAGGGVLVVLRPRPTKPQQSGVFIDCSFVGNLQSSGIALFRSRGARIVGGRIEQNGFDGVVVGTALDAGVSATDTTIENVGIVRNGGSGIRVAGSFSRLVVSGCAFEADGTSARQHYFGLDADLPGGFSGVRLAVLRNTFTGLYGGVRTSKGCVQVALAGNTYSGVVIPRRLLDAPRTRTDLDD